MKDDLSKKKINIKKHRIGIMSLLAFPTLLEMQRCFLKMLARSFTFDLITKKKIDMRIKEMTRHIASMHMEYLLPT